MLETPTSVRHTKGKRMEKIVNLSDVRNRCDLTEKSGEELLKQLLLTAKNSEETEEYKVFLSALKALREASDSPANAELRMQVKYDREKQTVNFNFRFESVPCQIQ